MWKEREEGACALLVANERPIYWSGMKILDNIRAFKSTKLIRACYSTRIIHPKSWHPNRKLILKYMPVKELNSYTV